MAGPKPESELPAWPEQILVTDPSAVALLTDFRALRALEPFLRDAHTLTTAARASGRAPSSLAHWVPRFVECGLLEQVEVIRRAGAPMVRYRTPGRRLVVPYADLPFDARVRFLDEGRLKVLRRFQDGLDEAMAATNAFGMSFGVHSSAGTTAGSAAEGIAVESVPLERSEPDQDPPATDHWAALRLDEADAHALTAEIDALVQKYSDRSGARDYVVHLGIAPDPQRPWRSIEDRWPG